MANVVFFENLQLSLQIATCYMSIFLRKAAIYLGLLLNVYSVKAQVINIESKRMNENRQGWIGQGEFAYSYIQNQTSISNLNTRLNLLYVKEQHAVMLLNDLSIIQSSEGDFENRGYQHVRYNYKKTDRLTYEAFTQVQFSKQMRLYPRFILGGGPRYKVFKADSIKIYTGASLFFEHEEMRDPIQVNSNERLNMYFSYVFTKVPGVVIDMLIMYQPRLIQLSDRRIQTELRLDFSVSKLLQVRFAANIFNDNRPPLGVPQTFSNMRSGVLFNF